MASGRFTLIIKNGLVYDGSGSPPFMADIGIRGDTIAHVGHVQDDGDMVIDASGLAVAPGFIDTHGHSEFSMLASPEAHGKLMQGITTEVNGNCGLSAAPLMGPAKERREADQLEYGIRERWETLGEYFSLLESRGPSINYATLAGHGNIRASVIGYEDREPTGQELDSMKALLARTLSEGAIGLSTGLIYPPGVYSDIDEIAALAGAGREASSPFIYTSHMRSEGQGLLESIAETIETGRRAGCPVHISHIKTAGRDNWPKAAGAIRLMEDARAEGLAVTCDRYPYIAAATDLDSVLPAWMFEGGSEEELRRLRDPAVIERLRETSLGWPDGFEAISVSDVATEANRWAEGLSIAEIAARWAMEPLDAIVRLLIEEGLRVGAIFRSMCQENLRSFLSLPYCMVGSDSSARSFEGITRKGRPHPRGFGSMPRFLRMALDGELGTGGEDTLAGAICRMTGLAARTFRLKGRGGLMPGMMADAVVFDPVAIGDTATFEDPFSPPRGIVHVIVNGVASVSGGRPTGRRAGRVLRGGTQAG